MMLKRWTRSVALLLAVLFCLSGCSKAEKVDYDTHPLSFETVFDDTLGNPDKPDTADSELCRYEPPAYRIRIYHFVNTIAKGAFYLLPPNMVILWRTLHRRRASSRGFSPSIIRKKVMTYASTALPYPMKQQRESPFATRKCTL